MGRICLACAIPAVFVACSAGGLEYTDTDVVITVRDPNRHYDRYKTYAVPDEILDLCDGSVDDGEGGAGGAGGEGGGGAAGESSGASSCVPVNHAYDDEILAAIRRNMDDLGFDEVEPNQHPDVMVLSGAVAQNSWYAYYPYCDYWYGYCFGYGWGPAAVSYRRGTLLMYMVATSEANDERGTVPVVWVGGITGIVSGSTSLDASRIDVDIDQAFAQSRYLGEGK